jgi:hypothetical protein
MAIPQLRINYSPDPINLGFYVTWVESPAGLIYQKEIISVVTKLETVGFGYRTPGIATTPVVQAPTFVCGLMYTFVVSIKKDYVPFSSWIASDFLIAL